MSTGEEPPARLDDLDTDFRFDPEKPLEPIKKAVEGADEDLIPGRVAAVIKAMASCGMDDEVRITVRAFVKKNRFFPLEDFDHIVFSATPRKGRTPAHPRADQPEDLCALDGVCAHTPPLASREDLLAEVVDTVHELGVTGESRIIKATYLTAVSQVLTSRCRWSPRARPRAASRTRPGPPCGCSPRRLLP